MKQNRRRRDAVRVVIPIDHHRLPAPKRTDEPLRRAVHVRHQRRVVQLRQPRVKKRPGTRPRQPTRRQHTIKEHRRPRHRNRHRIAPHPPPLQAPVRQATATPRPHPPNPRRRASAVLGGGVGHGGSVGGHGGFSVVGARAWRRGRGVVTLPRPPMLLTLCANALASKLLPGKSGKPELALTDLPAFIRDHLGLFGMTLTTPLLAGLDRARLQKIVEAADKTGCPCLSLLETEPQPLADPDKGDAAMVRVGKVVEAARLLGCNAVGIRIGAPDDDDALDEVADRLRPLVRKAEKMEMNICVASGPGLTARPERIAELLKRIGGFRVGTMPDFASAAAGDDALGYLRRLVPYASTVIATVEAADAAPKARKAPTAPTTDAQTPDTSPSKTAKPKAAKAKKSKPPDTPSAPTTTTDPITTDPTTTDPTPQAAPTPKAAPTSPSRGVSGFGAGPVGGFSFDVPTFAATVNAVGFDGALAIDYRGQGDPVAALVKAREMIHTALGRTPVLEEETAPEPTE